MSEEEGSDGGDRSIWILMGVFAIVFALVGSVLVLLLSMLINRFVTTDQTIGTAVQIVSITVSGLLTLGLILIYRDIRESEQEQERWMEKQTDTLRAQQRLTEAQITPILSVSFADDDVEGSQITITCKNTGTGLAKGLELDFRLFVSDVDRDSPVGVIEGDNLTPLSDVSEHEEVEIQIEPDQPMTVDASRGFWSRASPLVYAGQSDGQRIRSEPVVKSDREETFESSLIVMEYSGPGADPGEATPVSWEHATTALVEMGFTTIGYQVSFKYENILGEEGDRTVIDSGFTELTEDMDFVDIYSQSAGQVGRLPQYRMIEERYIAMFDY